jgi:hypothetical protein
MLVTVLGCDGGAGKRRTTEVTMNPTTKRDPQPATVPANAPPDRPAGQDGNTAVPPGPRRNEKSVIIRVLPEEASDKAQVLLYGKKVLGPLVMSTSMTTRLVVQAEGYQTFDEYVTPPTEGNVLTITLRK